MCTCTCIYVYMYVCVHVHVCIIICICHIHIKYYLFQLNCMYYTCIYHIQMLQGQIQALESEILHIRFFPGIPQPFKKLIQVLY